jgi:hypothetical protein
MNALQTAALARLEAEHGPASYVNAFKPERAVHADFGSVNSDGMRSFRIAPDGKAQDITEALLEAG